MANPFYVQPAAAGLGQAVQPIAQAIGENAEERKAQERLAAQEAIYGDYLEAIDAGDFEAQRQIERDNPILMEQLTKISGSRQSTLGGLESDMANDYLFGATPEDLRAKYGSQLQSLGQGQVLDQFAQLAPDQQRMVAIMNLDADKYKRVRDMQGGSDDTGKIGTYNPRDYTVESFSKFVRTKNPADLERYTEKTIMVGDVPHMLDPNTKKYVPLKSATEIGQDKATVQSIVTQARKEAENKVNKTLSQEGQANKLDQADRIYKDLSSADLDKIYGFGESIYPDFLRSEEGVTLQAKRDQLIGMLQLAGRGELKGQGPITDSEQAIVARAATILSNPNIDPNAAKSALNEAMEILYRNAGKEFTPLEVGEDTTTTAKDFDLEFDPATGTFK